MGTINTRQTKRITELEGLLEVTQNNLEAMERDDKDLRGHIALLEKDIGDRDAEIRRLRRDLEAALCKLREQREQRAMERDGEKDGIAVREVE